MDVTHTLKQGHEASRELAPISHLHADVIYFDLLKRILNHGAEISINEAGRDPKHRL